MEAQKDALKLITTAGFDPRFGDRPVKRTIILVEAADGSLRFKNQLRDNTNGVYVVSDYSGYEVRVTGSSFLVQKFLSSSIPVLSNHTLPAWQVC